MVRAILKNMDLLNWFVPLMIGAPLGFNKTNLALVVCFILTLTVCWDVFNIDNTLKVTTYQFGQSAGNQINFEHPRDYMLVIANVSLIKLSGHPSRKDQLGSYLAGLIEGDGHVLIPSLNELSKKRSSPRVEITFHNSNYPLALKLMETLSCGNVRSLNTQNAYRLTIYKPEELVKLVILVDKHLRTPKIEAFNHLIDWLNNNTNNSLSKISKDTSSLLNNAWLAGFSDADSNFYIRTTEKKFNPNTGKWSKSRYTCRFVLEQRKIEPKFLQPTEPFMKQIAETFNVNLLTSKHNNPPKEYWHINISSRTTVKQLIKYFEYFPLMGSKYLDYLDFKTVNELIEQNAHLTESGQLTIRSIKNKMNKVRTEYTWNHLDNFYS